MGDLQAWLSQPNGFLAEDRPFTSSSSSNPHPSSIGADCWVRAEQATQEVICRIQPTVVSEQRRKAVIDYVQRLIKGYLVSEVFPFGSVPLKTYLPDGDIDLTALSNQNLEDSLANDVRAVLEVEEQNNAAQFEVKDVQYIHAEVKLVKCLVQNIVVDISFNQLGGLSTLCFLEQVDRLIGKDNLFKRSIILIKAWCYYESRILGAHHGLISTYALETLVLYIFHLFHSSLNGPLAVLYRFLDYFSKFDWDNYCISLNGPVCISSLPVIVVDTPENEGGDLFLSDEFLRNCVDMFSVPSRGLENNSRAFPQKHLNILDPLKENNNLGRSVSKGNFYRIRSAFTYGARKLGKILSPLGENIEDEVKRFFMNTLDRHGSGRRPDVQDPIPAFSPNGSAPSTTEKSTEDKTASESLSTDYLSHSNIRISGTERKPGIITSNENAVSGYRLAGDAKDLATPRTQVPRIINQSRPFAPNSEPGSSFEKAPHAPHLYFSLSFPENEKIGNGNPHQTMTEHAVNEETGFLRVDSEETEILGRLPFSNGGAYSSEDLCFGYREDRIAGTSAESLEALSSSLDLTGDYDSHLKSLMYAQWCHEYGFVRPIMPIPPPSPSPPPPPSPSQFRNKHGWETVRQSMQLKHNVFPHMNGNGVIPGPPLYPINPPVIPATGFGVEEMPKPRGTGTYFPNTSHHSYWDRSSSGRGKNMTGVTQGQLQRTPRHTPRAAIPPEKGNYELSQAQFPDLPGRRKPGPSEILQPGHPASRLFPQVNGLPLPSERLEFGSFGSLPLGVSLPEVNRNPDCGTQLGRSSSPSLPSPVMQRPRPVSSMKQERVAVQSSYHLKDEDDFPPLSV